MVMHLWSVPTLRTQGRIRRTGFAAKSDIPLRLCITGCAAFIKHIATNRWQGNSRKCLDDSVKIAARGNGMPAAERVEYHLACLPLEQCRDLSKRPPPNSRNGQKQSLSLQQCKTYWKTQKILRRGRKQLELCCSDGKPTRVNRIQVKRV